MNNLIIINNTNFGVIRATLEREGVSQGHFTNGVFAGKPEILLPTNLACFKLIDDRFDDGVFIIGVNSDESLDRINAEKAKIGEDLPQSIPQQQRAEMIGQAVASQFSQRDIFVVFYDGETPVELYTALKESHFGMKTLFKGNYGTNPQQGRIEGDSLFERVIAFPLPFQTAQILPYAAGVTEKSEVSSNVEILRLTEELGSHGRPYMTEGNKLLFPTPNSLQYLCDDYIKPNRGAKPAQP